MQANPNDEMDRQYQNLTEKQRAVIDAHAKNPDVTNRETARIAGEEILGQDSPVNESYCSEILNKKFTDLAQYRVEIEQNERPTGDMQTTGDPFQNIPDNKEPDVQTIQERPVTDAGPDNTAETAIRSNSPIQVMDAGDGVLLKLNYRYVQELLESTESQLPDELHEQLVDIVVQKAFN